ncbi:Thrombospondin type 1 domain [Nesidiocoris tenuis]|uniref:Thrombospondin type 1 domain n=1 Tax=Nesidiocoris tenuis TaxID=355587 RepID=A0ABN7AJJ5_9HEMI|nr:Thrombospondin type 1 domain [Nesidiocoris tenuis]
MAAFNLMSAFVVLVVAVKCNTPSSVESDYSDDEEFTSIEALEGWSDWSPCSRTCDGGTSFQIRKCAQCLGPSVRYRICNMQPCPDSIEFRDQQCAAYNDLPYDDKLMTWVGYSGLDSPLCELWCQSDTGVIAKMAPSVKDGTRCRPGSLDLCVEGQCQKVGCDLMIGSEAKVDVCGICGGDGSTCNQPLYHWVVQSASLCSATCGTGYKMSQVACKNMVSGSDVESKLCDASQKPKVHMIECNTHPCPSKWVAGTWSKCSVSCATGVRSRTVTCMKKTNSTLIKVAESYCKHPKLRTTEPCSMAPCPPTWITRSWTKCSASCGEGTEWREVVCSDDLIGCDETSKPESTRICNAGVTCPPPENTGPSMEVDDTMMRILQPYPPFRPVAERLVGDPILSSFSSSEPHFKAEGWSECSVSCGDGVRKRDVSCTIFLEFSRTYAKLPDSHCRGTKPADTEPCSLPPCPLRVETVRDGFSDSSGYVDNFKRMQYSESGIRVAPHQSGKTYTWKMQGYTHCSASCLGGVQESIIMCVQEDDEKVVGPYLCSTNTRPETLTRTCNDHPCPPRWNHTEFQACSKPCGMGIQTREVYCIHEVTRGGSNTVIVPGHMCPQPPPPDRQYCNVLDCPINWHSSEWSKCSKRCGGGVKRRNVECKQIMAQNHVVSRPESQCPKNKPPDQRPCNTKPCPSEEQRPPIISTNQSYVQSNPIRRKVSLKIGGSAQVFHGSLLKIKCPVKKFDRAKIQWAKDHKLISSSKKYRISKKGALRIQEASYGDTGVFTCLAGRSSADITITVKARPGEFPSSEEIEKHTSNQLDPAMHSNGDLPHRPFLPPGDDESHEQHPGESASPRRKAKFHTVSPPTTHHQPQQTTANEKWLVVVGSTEGPDSSPTYLWPDLMPPPTSSSASRPLPHIQQIISNIQRLSGMHTVKEQPAMDQPMPLGSGSLNNMEFEWILSDWSPCSVTCGDSGYQMRTVHCMVLLQNSSKNVEASVCLDAGLSQPITKQKCGWVACPYWVPSDWQPCTEARCFTYNTAMQRRNIECHSDNGTILEDGFCDDSIKPMQRQECYNDKCKGTWKVGDWSECAASCDSQGVKYRILQCVWYGTKKPAGNACRDLPRPSVMKMCKGPACSDKSECLDHSKYCQNIRAMNMCRMYRYQTQCCQSCSDSKH